MRTGLVSLVIVCLLSSWWGDALLHAQNAADPASQVRTALVAARKGRNVLVKLADGHKVRGKFEAVEGDRIAVRVNRAFRPAQLRTYQLDEVVEVRWPMSDAAAYTIAAGVGIPLFIGLMHLMLRPGK